MEPEPGSGFEFGFGFGSGLGSGLGFVQVREYGARSHRCGGSEYSRDVRVLHPGIVEKSGPVRVLVENHLPVNREGERLLRKYGGSGNGGSGVGSGVLYGETQAQ